MFDTDQMTDSPELRELRDSMSTLAMPERPRLEQITARGRARRRRQRAGVARLSVVGAVAAAAVAVTLTGIHGRSPTLGTIRTASFTIHRSADGTTALAINPKEPLDPTALQSDLAKYGIPAKVTVGRFCSSDPAPAVLSQVVSTKPAGQTTRVTPVAQPTITFDGTAMPAGTELSFGNFQLPSGQQQANLALIDTNSYTCTSTPPPLGPKTPGFALLYGGPGPAGS